MKKSLCCKFSYTGQMILIQSTYEITFYLLKLQRENRNKTLNKGLPWRFLDYHVMWKSEKTTTKKQFLSSQKIVKFEVCTNNCSERNYPWHININVLQFTKCRVKSIRRWSTEIQKQNGVLRWYILMQWCVTQYNT